MNAGPDSPRRDTSWPPTLPSSAATPTIRFASTSSRVGQGLEVGEDRSPPPGRLAVVMAALMIGLLMMGTQLWLLTVALELHLSGHGRQGWLLALVSGAIFAGGVLILRLLDRRPHQDR
jgi:hypothetical protein